MLARFRSTTSGATVVEFAILMPVMLVCFGTIVEGARIYWNYQSAVSGVRDAARYLARTTDGQICVGLPAAEEYPGHDLIGNAVARARIRANMGDGSANLFPTGVRFRNLQTRLLCYDTPGHSAPLTPVAVVRMEVVVDLPFGAVMEFFGRRENTQMISVITDQSRIYGL
jgi:hypothetical protein